MKFRPCIDIHNGKVKQIVGGSLRDAGDSAQENYVSEKGADWYARKYAGDGLTGGHVILLNPVSSPYYEETKEQAFRALGACPGLLQVGGGITPANAAAFLDAGASHVIVTSYVFKDGKIDREHLKEMVDAVGKERLVLDLSCREREGSFVIVTDRWQKFTDVKLTEDTLKELSGCCDEFLVHAADVEGMSRGPQKKVLNILGNFNEVPVTYAGGIGTYEDIDTVAQEGKGHVDLTIGSSLDLFGGKLSYQQILIKIDSLN